MSDCRLVLIVREADATGDAAARLGDALAGGDVAAVIIEQDAERADLAAFQSFAAPLVAAAQAAGAAAIIAGDSRALGRLKADGLHLGPERRDVDEQVKHANGRYSVGASAGQSRHEALEAGEARPDYVFFGRFDGDTHDDAHPASLRFSEWWATIIEIPCIVMGGRSVGSIAAIAATGAEFAALSRAVLEASSPMQAVREANALLNKTAGPDA